jgi:hypothetical protein
MTEMATNIPDLETGVSSVREASNGNTATKSMGVLLMMISVIVGIIAVFQFNSREIEYMRERVNRLEATIAAETLLGSGHHAKIDSKLEANKERFAAAEAQFKSLREVMTIQTKHNEEKINRFEKWLDWWNKTVPGRDANQDVRIKSLENCNNDAK